MLKRCRMSWRFCATGNRRARGAVRGEIGDEQALELLIDSYQIQLYDSSCSDRACVAEDERAINGRY
jgi:hypothetical protein